MPVIGTAKPRRRANSPPFVIGTMTGSLVAALNSTGDMINMGRCPRCSRPPVRPQAESLLQKRPRLEALASVPLPDCKRTLKIRYHGDYHLGQVLVCGNDFTIIDVEGEPARTLAARRRKSSPCAMSPACRVPSTTRRRRPVAAARVNRRRPAWRLRS